MEIKNNIFEDHCSFEVSKLLKEKGFDSYATREVYKIDGSDRFCFKNDTLAKYAATQFIYLYKDFYK